MTGYHCTVWVWQHVNWFGSSSLSTHRVLDHVCCCCNSGSVFFLSGSGGKLFGMALKVLPVPPNCTKITSKETELGANCPVLVQSLTLLFPFYLRVPVMIRAQMDLSCFVFLLVLCALNKVCELCSTWNMLFLVKYSSTHGLREASLMFLLLQHWF